MEILREITLDGIEAVLILLLFCVLFNQKKYILENKIRASFFFITYIAINCYSTYYLPDIYHTLIIILFSVLLLAYFTKINLFSSTVIILLFFAISFLVESLAEFLEMFLFKIDLNKIVSVPQYLWILIIIAKSLQIFSVLAIYTFSKPLTKFNLFRKEGRFLSDLIIQIGTLSLLMYMLSFSVFDVKNIRIYNLVIFLVYFVFIIIGYLSLKERGSLLEINNEYKIQSQQIKDMEEIISIIRQEKHDYANHINVIQGLCCLNKPNTVDRIRNYVSEISDSIHSSFRYLDTGNDYLDGLLSIKNSFAMKNNIAFIVNIDEHFDLLDVREDELISILSNLIDNAFQAFNRKSNIENKEISIKTFLENNYFSIEISDNGDKIEKNIIDKIFDKGFSTKTSSKKDHGYGLFITKQLVEQNGGNISVESTENRTKFIIKFKMKRVR